MFLSRKGDIWVSLRVLEVEQDMLNSISWKLNAEEQTQWYRLFSQAEIWSRKTEKSRFDVLDRKVEKQISSYWEE